MKRIILTTILISIFSLAFAQNDLCKTCGPQGIGLENKRENIIDGKELEAPYNGVIHLRVTRFYVSSNISSASFIENDLIITANHNLMYSPFITKIELYLNGKWIKVKKKHLRIYHYHQGLFHKKSKDIAIIKIKNTSSIEEINHTKFKLKVYDDIDKKDEKIFHLTGFPCDRPNTLVDKRTTSKELSFDSTNKIVGYSNLYTCTGDSGAPFWFLDNEEYYVSSIHHGKMDIKTSDNKAINVGSKITADVIKWINEKYK